MGTILNQFITRRALVFPFMSNIPIAFYVLGSLFTLYMVAATWRSKDAPPHLRSEIRRPRVHSVTLDRRLSHWWRARQRSKKLMEAGRRGIGTSAEESA